MDNPPTSIAGQIIQLYDQGFSVDQIVAELRARPALGKMTKERVQTTLRQFNNRGMDSRRIFEIYEMSVEILGIARELLHQQRSREAEAAKRRRAIEKQLPERLGAAIDKLNGTPSG